MWFKEYTTLTFKHGWTGTGSSVFADNGTVDGSMRIGQNFLFAHKFCKTDKLVSQYSWIMTQSILPKQLKIFSRHRNRIFFSGWVNHPIYTKLSNFSATEDNTKGSQTKSTEGSRGQGKESQYLPMCSILEAVTDCKKNWKFVISPIT